MDGPPRDDSTGDASSDDDGRSTESTAPTDRDTRRQSWGQDTADHKDVPSGSGAAGDPDRSEFDDPVGDLLPHAEVDSRWWYWIAAIPLYVILGGLLAVLFVGALIFDLFLTGGIASIFGAFIVLPILGLVGLILTILFPVATYIDARAVAASDASWTPDPLVWGLAALATVVLSAFTLSFVLALYYLYKRHVAVGTP